MVPSSTAGLTAQEALAVWVQVREFAVRLTLATSERPD